MSKQLSPAAFLEIQYRSDSTNPDALNGSAKLAATDRRELLEHIEHQREQMQGVLRELFALPDPRLHEMPWLVLQAAAKLGLTLRDEPPLPV